ncbi:hypothetical protein OQA88_931 [Cercophora sp. LCS_1]
MEEHEMQAINTESEAALDTIKTYVVLQDGQICPENSDPKAEPKQVVAYLHAVEGTSPSIVSKVRESIPITVPDYFFDFHRHENLSQITEELEDNKNIFLAKWTRKALQAKDVWLRENRLRYRKTPFNVDNANPVASQLDHERYDHVSEPYRSYNPLLEYEEKDQEKTKDADDDRPTTAGSVGTSHAPVPTATGNEATKGPQGDVESRDDDLERAQRPSTAGTGDAGSEATSLPRKSRTAVAPPQKIMVHAANECISLHHELLNGKLHCFILFDPPRRHSITRVRYNLLRGGSRDETSDAVDSFREDDSDFERFISILPSNLPSTSVDHSSILDAITAAIVRLVLNDQAKFLAALSSALDEIELTMERGIDVPQSWRDYPPRWRTHLFHQMESIEYLKGVLKRENALSSASKRLKVMTQRVEGTYQVLMSAMSILESEKAIEQAEVVTRLTNLAFLFIPPTFVAGVFGMNINEFENKLTWWIWVAITVGITAFAYIVRYRQRLTTAVRHAPSTVRALRWDMLVAQLRRWTQVIRSAKWLAEFVLWVLVAMILVFGRDHIPIHTARLGLDVTLLALMALKGPLPFSRHPFLQLSRVSLAITAVFFAGVGVALWRVIDYPSIDWVTTCGIVYGAIVVPAFFTPLWWFVSTKALLSGQRGPSDDRPLITGFSRWQNVVARLLELALYPVLGVALWKLFTDPMPVEVNTGVACGVGVATTALGWAYNLIQRYRRGDSLGDDHVQTVDTNVSRVVANMGLMMIVAGLVFYLSFPYADELENLSSDSLFIPFGMGFYVALKHAWAAHVGNIRSAYF